MYWQAKMSGTLQASNSAVQSFSMQQVIANMKDQAEETHMAADGAADCPRSSAKHVYPMRGLHKNNCGFK